ncbi:MAG: hypothetical protein H6625_02450 [Bdellovibrionaceae bacterium]|nr:hypothetical protein [Pseudobdellovibrionaceae bacterium]
MKFNDFIKKITSKERDHALLLPAKGPITSETSEVKSDKTKNNKKAGS